MTRRGSETYDRSCWRVGRASLRTFRGDERGTTAVLVAASVSLLAGAAGAAVDYASLAAQRQALQRAADAAAIVTTRELTLTSASDTARLTNVARAVVNTQLGLPAADQSVQVSALPNAKQNGVNVAVGRKPKPGLVGLFTPPSELAATASASRSGRGKLCVLALANKDANENEVIKMTKYATAQADDCGVFSNSRGKEAVAVVDGAQLIAPVICSAGGYKLGNNSAVNYQGDRRSDCPTVDDPMKERIPSALPGSSAPCMLNKDGKPDKFVIEEAMMVNGAPYELKAGRYCKGIEIKGKTRVVLRAVGNNNMVIVQDGKFELKDTAELIGGSDTEDTGVTIAFTGSGSGMTMDEFTTVSLRGPVSGPLPGVIILGNVNGSDWDTYEIKSRSVSHITGMFYIPRGHFKMSAKAEGSRASVGHYSAWTAIVANRFTLDESTHLHLNTNYHQTKVPVPEAVRGAAGPVVLTQ